MKYNQILQAITLGLVLSQQVLAQETILVAEHQKRHKKIVIEQGATIRYKKFTEHGSLKGRVNTFTDSTITFENKKGIRDIVPFKDIKEIVIPNKNKILGATFIALGTALAIPLFSDHGGDITQAFPAVAGYILLGLPLQIVGLTLVTSKEIDLRKKWKLKFVDKDWVKK